MCFQPSLFFSAPKQTQPHTVALRHSTIAFDFNPHYIDSKHFPLKNWRKAGKALFQARHSSLLGLGDKQGKVTLDSRFAITFFIARCEMSY